MPRFSKLTGVSVATLNRPRTTRLKLEQSDRILRLLRVFNAAVQTFEGDAETARRWLHQPAVALAGRRPIEHCSTEAGAEEVRNLLGAIDHGLYL